MRKMETIIKNLVKSAVDKERDGWPPVCAGIFHQPERPSQPEADELGENNSF